MKKYAVIYEEIDDPDFDKGFYYAHIPSLGLTTHGIGIENAKLAAIDLLKLWTDSDQKYSKEKEVLFSTLEI